MGERLKFGGGVPKKGSRDEAVEILPARKLQYFETDWSRAIHMSIMLDDPLHIFPN